jgi:capsular polysaccharide transport system permease protein
MTEEKLDDRKVQKTLVSGLRLPAFLKGRGNLRASSPLEIVSPGPGPDRMALLPATRRTRPSFYLLSFIGLVLLPALLATIYLLFLASDIYIAEARFAVRKAAIGQSSSDKAASAVGALTGGVGGGAAGGGMADQEAHIVANYLRSRAAIEDIQKELNIIDIFQRPGVDFWARLKRDPSKEDLVDYWNSMISTYVDGPSGVVTVTAKAFRPEDARQLVEAFIRSSERLANLLSQRARRDAMEKSEEEVRRAEGMVRQALADLRQYRDQEGFITPLMEATSTSKLLAETMSERIKLQNDYFVAVRALSPDSPSVQGLKSRLEGLDAQIEKLKGQLTSRSTETRSVSASLVKFEGLELRRVFAEKMYSMAQDALERARLRAEQQAIYVSVFVPPYLPQEAQFPKRFSMSAILFIGFLLAWGVGALMVAAVEDHKL